MLVPQEVAFNISSKSTTCLQDHQTDPDIPTDAGHTGTRQKGAWSLYHVVLLGRRDWQKDLGTGAWRELNRLRRGLQGRDWLWTSREACGEEKKGTKGEAEGQKWGGEEQQVNHRRHFTWTTRPPSSLATKPGVAGSFHNSPIRRRNPIHSLPISHSNCVALVRNLRTLKAKVCDLNAHLRDFCIHGSTAFVERVIQRQVSWRRAHPQRRRPLEGRKAIDTQQILEPSQFLQVVRTVWTNGVNSGSNITRLAVFLSPALHLLQAGESVYWKHAVF